MKHHKGSLTFPHTPLGFKLRLHEIIAYIKLNNTTIYKEITWVPSYSKRIDPLIKHTSLNVKVYNVTLTGFIIIISQLFRSISTVEQLATAITVLLRVKPQFIVRSVL